MSASYLPAIRESFLKLDHYLTGPGTPILIKPRDEAERLSYQHFETRGDSVVITFDTSKVRFSYVDDGVSVVRAIVKYLKAVGIHDTVVEEQYREANPNPSVVHGVSTKMYPAMAMNTDHFNEPKLTITLPNQRETVACLKRAYRLAVAAAATKALISSFSATRQITARILDDSQGPQAPHGVFLWAERPAPV